MRRPALLALALLALAAPWPPAAVAEHLPCQEYPVGRCGAYAGEVVRVCHRLVGGLVQPATDEDALTLPPTVGDGAPAPQPAPTFYVRPAAVDAWRADPVGDLPWGLVWQEDNGFDGLQPRPFRCGSFEWRTHDETGHGGFWVGPFDVTQHDPDTIVV